MEAKVGFLFGAGAEGKGNYGIVQGYEFIKESLFAENKEKITKAIRSVFHGQYFEGKYKYQSNVLDVTTQMLRSFIVSKCINDKGFIDNNEDVLSILSKSDLKLINNPKYNEPNNDAVKDDIKKEFKKIVKGEIKNYDDIENEILKNLFATGQKNNIIVDVSIGISGNIDKYFHSIIDPGKYGPVKFSYIFNYYWFCYFAIIEGVMNHLNKCGYSTKDYCNEEGLSYEKILNDISRFTKYIYSFNDWKSCSSYYSLIKEYLGKPENKHIKCKGAATTNYFKFIETLHNDPIYLNGQLKYFEVPELLEVCDLTKNGMPDNKIFFPFIFGQSLVKPIVHKIQAKSFYRFEKMLDNIDVLVICGFNINEDDNHINSFLHQFAINDKKRLIYVTEKGRDLSRNLKCNKDDIEYCCVKYGDNKKVVEKIFRQINRQEAT